MWRDLLPRLLGLLGAWPLTAGAQALAVPNLNPLTQIYGVPSARTGMPGDRVSIAATVASHYVSESNNGEGLLLDGETTRTEFSISRALTSAWRVGAVLPQVHHGGGELDGAINNWHRLFGLPDGGRDAAPIAAYDFHYRRAGVTAVRTQAAGGGIGDVQVFADFAPDPVWLLQTTLKLPTGKSAELRGSGAADLTVLAGAQTPPAPLRYYGYAGAMWRGRGDVLPAQARTGVGLAQAGIAWTLLPELTLQAQLDGHTGFYRASELAALGPALQLSVGGRWRIGTRTALSLAVGEDIAVATAPDVTFHLALDTRY